MNNLSCGIVSVLIGREFALTPLLDYFKNVEIPEGIDTSLNIVLGCDVDFEVLLKSRIEELDLKSKYKSINFIPGNLKCYTDLSWSEWENYTRKQEPLKKHRAALNNIEIGLNAVKENTYIHFVDDDTIPPNNALKDLLKTYQSNDNCGITSGIYFNKTWVEATAAVSEVEASRRIVGSFQKHKWLNCSIDDLAIENYKDVGFVGNGCMLISGKDVKSILPLSEWREQGDEEAPPDFIICRRIRRLGKIITIVPSVLAQHLDQQGNPVGLSPRYLENVKNATGHLKVLVTHYSKYLNYKTLSTKFDKILILHHKEIHKKIPNEIVSIQNVEIIERSISKTCQKYSHYKNYVNINGESMAFTILEEMHNFVKDKYNYIIYYYDSTNNAIVKIPLLDSNNLKKLLNQKP